MCPSADFSHAGNFRNLEIIWWLVFSNLKKNKTNNNTIRDHNRESVLEHIRSAHYSNNNQQVQQQEITNGSFTTGSSSTSSSSSSKLMLSGGQVLNGRSSESPPIQIELLPPPASTTVTSSPAAFRCGVCHQVSNWKHVIQVFLCSIPP